LTLGAAPRRIALLQLSSGGTCALVRVLECRQLPPWLAQLLADPAVLKLGVGIAEDARRLAKDFGLAMQVRWLAWLWARPGRPCCGLAARQLHASCGAAASCRRSG
jgi:acetyl esterase/lipase